MADRLTRSSARNIFYGGSVFFFLVFAGLVAHSHFYAISTSIGGVQPDEAVARGKHEIGRAHV